MGIPIPINEKPYYNTDDIANSIAADSMFDCYLEPVPGVGLVTRRRPGLFDFSDIGTGLPCDGIYYWDAMQMVIAINNGKAYKIAEDGTTTLLSGGTLINIGTPATFASGQDTGGTPWLYSANGKMAYTTDGTTLTNPSDANTPNATHVGWINSRYVANDTDTNRWLFTDTNPATSLMDNAYWSSTDNPVTCDARGDKLLALFTAWQEIYAWGSEGLQVFQDDGVTPFSNIPGAFSEIGIEAVYSFARADNTIFALCSVDGKRVVVKFVGRAPQIVSEPIARVLTDLITVSDARGTIIGTGGLAIYLLQFPTDQQTWAYDFKNDTWSRWGYYFGDADERQPFLGQYCCFAKAWNKHLITSRVDGKIYEISRDAISDAGTPIIPYRRTGHTDCGAPGIRKQCSSLYFVGKPGLTSAAKLMYRFRDDGYQVWSSWVELNFEQANVEPLNRQGTFRTRQYEFRIPAGMDTILVSGNVEIKPLGN